MLDINTIILILCTLLIVFLIAMALKPKLQSMQQQKQYERILAQIDEVYRPYNLYRVSMAARPKLDRWELTYGEFSIPVLFDLINTLPEFDQVKFYDIGSGAGKSALAVKLYRPQWQVTGIEYLPELHEIAEKHRQDRPGLEFICGDFLQHDFYDGNVIMINATAFNGEIWDQLHERILNVPQGTYVIITSKPLSETAFKKHYEGLHEMSWGFTSTYIYEKM